MQLIFTTFIALVAFAGNSVLCRLALGEQQIDAASFTIIRVLSGALTLFVLLALSRNSSKASSDTEDHAAGSWPAAIALFIYAVCFSYAYISLDTATGALILFGMVQLTMIVHALFKQHRLSTKEWIGFVLALLGLVYLLLPQASAPSLFGAALMSLSGVAWAYYTLAGKSQSAPLAATAYNFLRCVPLVALLFVPLMFSSTVVLTEQGIMLAILSGSVTSGIGYAIWYVALKQLSVIQAGVLQLLVPVFAAVGGIIFANEMISLQLAVSSALILGGILLVVISKRVDVKTD